tara:strand:- start:147 stop:671 length:525 start_codon:yes stop_codon:yes gene_type:complete
MKMKLTLLFLLIFLTSNAQEDNSLLSAQQIVSNASIRATAENKNIFLTYSASWCGWCKKMAAQIKDEKCADLFDKEYVFATLVVNETKKNKSLETPGGFEFLTEHRGQNAGLPFWVMLDKKGNLIENSFNPKSQNLGCPVSDSELDYFAEKLKRTSNLEENEIKIIINVFKQKK